MNRTPLLVLLCLGAPLLAQAPGLTASSGDSSLTLYGILDAGVATLSHTLDFDAYHPVTVNPTLTKPGASSATGMFNGGISQTRWGIRGETGLGAGWKAIFDLESAINIPTGNVSSAVMSFAMNRGTGPAMSADSAIDGQLFSRAAYLGLASGTWGTFTLGRHQSVMLDLIPGYDALQGAQLFTPIGFSGVYGGGGATDNSRVDSSVKYRVKLGAFTLGALHKFGGVAGNGTAKGVDEVYGAYESGPFGFVLAYQNAIDTTSVGNPAGTINGAALAGTAAYLANLANGTAVYQPIGTITAAAFDTHALMAAARYKAGDALFTVGYQRLSYTDPSDPSTMAALTSLYGTPIGTWVQNGAVVPAMNVAPYTVGGAQMEKVLTVWWAGARYDFTRRLSLAASYYHVGQNDFSNGTATAAAKAGATWYESALLDYAWTPAFDLYLGWMASKGDGGMVAGFAYDNNAVTGLGLRYRF